MTISHSLSPIWLENARNMKTDYIEHSDIHQLEQVIRKHESLALFFVFSDHDSKVILYNSWQNWNRFQALYFTSTFLLMAIDDVSPIVFPTNKKEKQFHSRSTLIVDFEQRVVVSFHIPSRDVKRHCPHFKLY